MKEEKPKAHNADQVFGEALKDPKFKQAFKKEIQRLQKVRGEKGGKATLKNHGVSHFSEASKKRWGRKKKTHA